MGHKLASDIQDSTIEKEIEESKYERDSALLS